MSCASRDISAYSSLKWRFKKAMGILWTHPSVHLTHPSVRPSRYLFLNHWAEFNETGKSVIFSVRPSGVFHAISKTNRRNVTKFASWFSLIVRVCESNIIFLTGVRQSGDRPSVRHAISSQITWRNLTKFATWLFLWYECARMSPSFRPSCY